MVLFDFKKAFDLVDHHILIQKLGTYNIHQHVKHWIVYFLTDRKQRVGRDVYSEWLSITARFPQDTKLGPWLFLIMINDLDKANRDMWKFVDDTTISEIIIKNHSSCLQSSVDSDSFCTTASNDKFQYNEGK